jgi:tRNA pseudouridine38-40 synthase
VRTVYALDVGGQGARVWFDVVADGFLHHMVRNIVGVLLAVAAGEAEPEWAREVLESRDRTAGGVTASAEGLYLVRVGYPARYRLPVVLPDSGVW